MVDAILWLYPKLYSFYYLKVNILEMLLLNINLERNYYILWCKKQHLFQNIY